MIERARRGQARLGQVRSPSMQLARLRDPQFAKQVATLALAETDSAIMGQILWAFRMRPFPLPDETLEPLVDASKEIRSLAAEALSAA